MLARKRKIKAKSVNARRILKRRPTKWIVKNSMAASGVTGIAAEALKAAHAAGCPAFAVNGNVDCDVLIKWLKKNQDVFEIAGARVNERQEKAMTIHVERLQAEHELQMATGKTLPLDGIRRDGTRFVMELKRKAFALPRRLAQVFALETDAINIEQKLNEELGEIFSDVSKKPWTSLDCPKCKTVIQS